jgi:hypothetical protein
MGSSPSPPAAPDPYKTAGSQENANIDAAIANSELNNVNQITPYGDITYKQTGQQWVGNAGGGPPNAIPTYTATTTLSPELQALVNSDLANSQQASNTELALGKNVASTLATPLDLGPNATSAYLDKLARAELDPQLAQQQAQLNQTLTDQGLTPGSEGWKYQQGQFGLNSAQQLNDLYLQGQNTAMTALEAQYNEPINALSALQSQSQVSQPGVGTLAPTTQSPIGPAPISQDVYNSYQGQLQSYQDQLAQSNALTSGLFGLGGSLISGGSKLFSDRDDKTDIEPLGRDPDSGLMIHAFRYKDDPKSYPKTVGPMAQDVEKKMPGAVQSIGGHKVIATGQFGLGR